ncbi:MAG: TonB family protein [Endomicrobium sp.]|jgi:TonB family protein|nr:TonB family protein [Endomicrobium sp.]
MKKALMVLILSFVITPVFAEVFTLENFLEERSSNKAAFDDKYLNKDIVLEGKISEIETKEGKYYAALGAKLSRIIFVFNKKDDILKIKINDNVKIGGVYKNVLKYNRKLLGVQTLIETPVIEDCKVIEILEAEPPVENEGTGFDASDASFEYPYYTDIVIRKVSRFWPFAESSEGLSAVVYFKILKNGAVTDIEIKDSSGDKGFNEKAQKAVKSAAPFPPLPEGYKKDFLDFYYEFK